MTLINIYMLICRYCGKSCKNIISIKTHERQCSFNENAKHPKGMLGKSGINQFTKDLTNIPESKLKGRPGYSPPKTPEALQKLSKLAKERGLGGVRQSKRISYNGKILGSTYEVKLVQDLDKNNIRWETCNRFPYIDPFGKSRTYTPDIYLPDYNVYLDPKNDFLINEINPRLGFKDSEKISLVEDQNSIKVIILNKHQLSWCEVQVLL